jgi:ABC-type dipeptide/oligopeptide/nickel transport system permease subunit
MNKTEIKKLFRPFLKRKPAVAGALVVLILVLAAVLAPTLAPHDPGKQYYEHMLEAPTQLFPLGTDQLGRDIYSRLLFGARLSLAVAAAGVVVGAVLGIPLGLVAGYYGKWWDTVIMRVMDVLLAFPGILLAIGIIAVLGPGMSNVMFAIAVFGIPQFARLVRGSTLQLKSRDFVQAAQSQGASDSRILFQHILPNAMAPIVVMMTLRTAQAILIASSLSFLGMGAAPPTAEWGAMLADGRAYIQTFPHIALFPGLAIFVTVLGLNLLGDGLNDMLDPRLRRSL